MGIGQVGKVCAAMTIAMLMQGWSPAAAAASWEMVPCEQGPVAVAGQERPRLTGGFNGTMTWLSGERDQFRIRKFTAKGGGSTIELSYRNDVVVISVDNGVVRVARDGRTLTVDSPESLEALQGLLAGSLAIYHTRTLLSELEGKSALKPVDMTLLSAAALAVSLTGDHGAPLRLADRFVARHRGIFRQVRFDEEASCYTSYETEVSDAWNDLNACMAEADNSGWLAGVRRLACNATWLLRGESAWFEYIKCLSPLTGFPKVE